MSIIPFICKDFIILNLRISSMPRWWLRKRVPHDTFYYHPHLCVYLGERWESLFASPSSPLPDPSSDHQDCRLICSSSTLPIIPHAMYQAMFEHLSMYHLSDLITRRQDRPWVSVLILIYLFYLQFPFIDFLDTLSAFLIFNLILSSLFVQSTYLYPYPPPWHLYILLPALLINVSIVHAYYFAGFDYYSLYPSSTGHP